MNPRDALIEAIATIDEISAPETVADIILIELFTRNIILSRLHDAEPTPLWNPEGYGAG